MFNEYHRILYFLQKGGLEKIIEAMPQHIPLIIILDDLNAVFTKIWKLTAPVYHERSISAHKIIKGLPIEKYSINKSRVSSKLPDPLSLEKDFKNYILSMLSYNDFSKLSVDTKDTVYSIIKDNMISEHVNCDNVFYEIVRKKI